LFAIGFVSRALNKGKCCVELYMTDVKMILFYARLVDINPLHLSWPMWYVCLNQMLHIQYLLMSSVTVVAGRLAGLGAYTEPAW